jgi:hypothetical protein
MPKQLDDTRPYENTAWPGPTGWWYLPLIWLVVVLVAMLAWSFN